MFSTIREQALRAGRHVRLGAAIVFAVAVALVISSTRPALALTSGQPVQTAFPRVAMWWPNASAPAADLAKLDYLVPYEWQPMQPDTTRLAALRAANPAQTLFADASTCELNYRQPDSAGNPNGPANYDSERIGAIPTSWILTQVGSTLSAPITTVSKPTQSIAVADGTKFRAGNLVIINDEKCLVVSVSGGTLVVRRGWAGSTAVNHTSGTRIAAAVSAWPYSVKVDLTDECPLGTATGEIATPGSGSERARDWMVRRTAAHYSAASFDGVAIDLGVGYISWFKGTGDHAFLSIASRSNVNAEVDYAAYDIKWAAALDAFQNSLRAQVGPNAIILVNEATPAFAALNGARIEDFPQKTTTTVKWHAKIIGPNKTYYPSYLEWCTSSRQPNFTTLQTYGDVPADYQLMRFGLTTALMGDGFYAFKVANANEVLRYDEYDNAGAGRGYLGKALGSMRSVVTLNTPDLVGSTGAFSDATALNGWTLYSRSGYAAVKTLDSATAKISVTQSAGNIGGVEFSRSGVAVTSGTAYTLSFRARADRPSAVQAVLQQGSSPWATYLSTPELALTTEWQTFELPVTSSGTDAAAVLKFLVGKSVGSVSLDDVKLQAGSRDAYRRDFEGGVALVNATNAAVSVNLGGTYRKIKGTQAPAVNDGSLVTAVTIPANDGLVLIRPAASAPVAPVANSDSYSTANATALTVAAPGVLGNDSDTGGATLAASAVNVPLNGTLSLSADGSFRYTPVSGFSGTDSFTYRVYNGTAYSTAATVSITVAAPAVVAPVGGSGIFVTDSAGGVDKPVARIGGSDRYAVAVNLALARRPGYKGIHDVIVVCGEDRANADPLASAALAGILDAPILLTNTSRLNATTKNVLTVMRSVNGPLAIHVVGGTTSVPGGVYNAIAATNPGGTIERISGADRYELSVAIANRAQAEADSRHVPMKAVLIFNAEDPQAFYQALAASPFAASARIPMLGVRANAVPGAVSTALSTNFAGKPRYVINSANWVTSAVYSAVGASGRAAVSSDRVAAANEMAVFAGQNGWTQFRSIGLANKLPDALTGGTFIGQQGGVLLYSDKGILNASTAAYAATLNQSDLAGWVFGGEASVAAGTFSQFKTAVNAR